MLNRLQSCIRNVLKITINEQHKTIEWRKYVHVILI